MRIDSISIEQFSSQYQFAFPDDVNNKAITESIFFDKKEDYSKMFFGDFNVRLEGLENKGQYSSILVAVEDQPKEILEVLREVGGGKFLRFMNQHVDGIAFGRDLESSLNEVFFDDLGAVATEEVSNVVTEGKMDRIIMVDTYNEAFQNVDTESQADELFTDFAQMLSVLTNELKQGYFVANNLAKEDEGTYQFMKDALVAVGDYIDQGGSLSFVGETQKEVFSTAVTMMTDSLDSKLSELGNDDNTRVMFSLSA